MVRLYYIITILFIGLIWSCSSNDKTLSGPNLSVQHIGTPCESGGEGNLYLTRQGEILLSWVEYTSDTSYSLRFSTLQGQQWTQPKEIANGTEWFVNWADFPSIIESADGSFLMAHWLAMSADGTYDYDVMLSLSHDKGETWSTPFKAHNDNIAAEHGFVSMAPVGNKILAVWLDGRNTIKNETNKHHHGQGSMTLRTALIDEKSTITEEIELDGRVCDCCQTSATTIDDVTIVAYRNRTKNEIRDIAVVRRENQEWSTPSIVYNDNWYFPACPVNGPVIASSKSNVAVAWYSVNDTVPEVKLSFSYDKGKNFDLPIRVDDGNPLGRVDLIMIDDQTALVSWLEKENNKTWIVAKTVNINGQQSKTQQLILTSSNRSSGFPRMVKSQNDFIMVYTQLDTLNDTRVDAVIITSEY